MILGPHTITIRRATTADDGYGNAEPDWDNATATAVPGCSVQPLAGTELLQGRDTVVTRWTVWAPPETDLVATDRVEWAGETYDVDGDVQRWDFPPLSHLVALLRRGENQ